MGIERHCAFNSLKRCAYNKLNTDLKRGGGWLNFTQQNKSLSTVYGFQKKRETLKNINMIKQEFSLASKEKKTFK